MAVSSPQSLVRAVQYEPQLFNLGFNPQREGFVGGVIGAPSCFRTAFARARRDLFSPAPPLLSARKSIRGAVALRAGGHPALHRRSTC